MSGICKKVKIYTLDMLNKYKNMYNNKKRDRMSDVVNGGRLGNNNIRQWYCHWICQGL